jgi:hypothetical protein
VDRVPPLVYASVAIFVQQLQQLSGNYWSATYSENSYEKQGKSRCIWQQPESLHDSFIWLQTQSLSVLQGNSWSKSNRCVDRAMISNDERERRMAGQDCSQRRWVADYRSAWLLSKRVIRCPYSWFISANLRSDTNVSTFLVASEQHTDENHQSTTVRWFHWRT